MNVEGVIEGKISTENDEVETSAQCDGSRERFIELSESRCEKEQVNCIVHDE